MPLRNAGETIREQRLIGLHAVTPGWTVVHTLKLIEARTSSRRQHAARCAGWVDGWVGGWVGSLFPIRYGAPCLRRLYFSHPLPPPAPAPNTIPRGARLSRPAGCLLCRYQRRQPPPLTSAATAASNRKSVVDGPGSAALLPTQALPATEHSARGEARRSRHGGEAGHLRERPGRGRRR